MKTEEENKEIEVPIPVQEPLPEDNLDDQIVKEVEEEKEEDKEKEEEKNVSQNVSIDDPSEKIQFRRKLLSTEEPKKYPNRLMEDYKYDAEGENGLFEADPKVITIAGFELNKKVTRKVKIINKSKWCERIIILPPLTSNFKIKYSKKGQIAPGLSEVIYLTFSPDKYQLYQDKIFINCTCAKISVPIIAYPKMDPHVKEYIPKLIDLGNVPVEEEQVKEVMMKNVIDTPFSFEITPLKESQEIKIFPSKGIIQPLNNFTINVKFKPMKYGIFRGEYELRVSEVNFVPFKFSVYGTSHDFKYGPPEFMDMRQSKERQRAKNILEKSKISALSGPGEQEVMRITGALEKSNGEEEKNATIREANKSLCLSNSMVEPPSRSQSATKSKMLERYKDFPSNIEKEFLNYYNEAENIINDKEFKYIRFVGKKPLTKEEEDQIKADRQQAKEKEINNHCDLNKNLHQTELDKELPVVDKNLEYYLKPNFNSNQNDNFFKTRHYFKIFKHGVSKAINRRRFEDKLSKVQKSLADKNIKNSEDCANLIKQDWLDYYSKDQEGDDDNSDEKDKAFSFLKMKFIPPKQLIHDRIYLSNEYSLNTLKQKIDHTNELDLDQYVECPDFERNDLEVMNYKPFVSPGMTQFDPDLGTKEFRPSNESEGLIRYQRGDSEMDFDNRKDLFELSDCFKQHLYTDECDLIFNNPTLKCFKQPNPMTETSYEYNLQPRKIEPYYNSNSTYKDDMYMKINFSYTDNENIRLRQLDSNSLYCDGNLDNIKMNKIQPDQKDLFIKKGEKVDEDNYINEMAKIDFKTTLDEIEKGDENMKKIREQIDQGITEDVRKAEKLKLEDKLQGIKKKWMSVVPTAMEYFNSGIVDNDNKMFI
ncbi:MAG: hypothetical protein MJ252_13970 [archaeon]|nr:hypothetical protein [archaeon]